MAIALMAWEEKFCLGLDEIDEQHKSLVDLINQIWESIIKESDNSVIFALIGELEKYTLAHFAAEETLMRITDYPAFDKHKKERQDFVARVSEEKAQAEATGQLSLDMMYFLRNWLGEHILISDKHYADYSLRNKKENRSLISRLFRRFF